MVLRVSLVSCRKIWRDFSCQHHFRDVTGVLTDDTKVQQPKGLGMRKKQLSATVLVPGLRVSVDGVGDA